MPNFTPPAYYDQVFAWLLAEARAYVEAFLPAYALYPAAMSKCPPVARFMTLTLGPDRTP